MKNKIKSLFKRDNVKNSVWIFSEKIIQALLNLIITMLSARYLGPNGYGLLSYGASLVTIFLNLTKLGLDSIIINEIINNRKKEGEYLGTSIVLMLISSIISIILIAIYLIVFQSENKLIIILSIIQSIVLIFRTFEILDYWFQSYLKSKYVSIARAIAYTTMCCYKIYLLITNKSVIWFAFSSILDYLIIAIFLMIFYNKMKHQKLKFSFKEAKYLLSKSYHFIISGVMIVIYTQIDKIMIGNMLGTEKLGYYTAIASICTMWLFVPETIFMSMRPGVISAKKESNELYKHKLKLTYSVIFWICIVFSFVTCIFSNLIVNILYGEQYMIAANSLRYLIWYIPFSQLGTASSIWIVSENKSKYLKYYVMIGAILNIILNYILIPTLGINGAIIATIITEFITCIMLPFISKETRELTKILFQSIIFKY